MLYHVNNLQLLEEKNQGTNFSGIEDAPNDFAIFFFFTSTIFNWPGAETNGLNFYQLMIIQICYL